MKVILAQPRGFCAGVVRAIDIVEKSLEKFGAPVYVRHEIVHNKHVVDSLKAKGAVFVEEIAEIATLEQRWRFELLRKAYVDARYNMDYTISKEDLDYLTERVRMLRELTELICKEKITSFTKEN